MKIAIASSGLGHVARGIETWALDTAVAVSQLSSCQVAGLLSRDLNNRQGVSLATEQPDILTTDLNVTLFCGASLPSSVKCHVVVIPCLKRNNWTTRQLSNLAPRFTWRWGWTSAYALEQKSFWKRLWPILRDEGYDILHVQDPLLADLCRQYRKAGKLRTKEILAHGTEEPAEFLAKFDYVQHLAPWHLEQTKKEMEEKRGITTETLRHGERR